MDELDDFQKGIVAGVCGCIAAIIEKCDEGLRGLVLDNLGLQVKPDNLKE